MSSQEQQLSLIAFIGASVLFLIVAIVFHSISAAKGKSWKTSPCIFLLLAGYACGNYLNLFYLNHKIYFI